MQFINFFQFAFPLLEYFVPLVFIGGQFTGLEGVVTEYGIVIGQSFIHFLMHVGKFLQSQDFNILAQHTIILLLNFGLESRRLFNKTIEIAIKLIFYFLITGKNLIFINIAIIVYSLK